MGFMYEGRDLGRVGSLFDEICRIARQPDEQAQAEAVKFKSEYLAYLTDAPDLGGQDPAAVMESNIGYLSGYAGGPEAQRIRDIFDSAHPILGRRPGELSVGQLLAMGAEAAIGRKPS